MPLFAGAEARVWREADYGETGKEDRRAKVDLLGGFKPSVLYC